MNIKNILLGLFIAVGFCSMSVGAQELISSNTYQKPGCAWQYSYTDGPAGPGAPTWRIQIFLLKCTGVPVLTMHQYINGRSECHVFSPGTGHTLTGTPVATGLPTQAFLCSNYSLHKTTPGPICTKSGQHVVSACSNSTLLQTPGITNLVTQECGSGCPSVSKNLGGINGCSSVTPLTQINCQ